MNKLLVSYNWSHYSRAKPEILRILQRFGDPDALVNKTAVIGIAVVHTRLNNRGVVRQCRALWDSEPETSFEFAIKWVPVDYWCDTDLTAMQQVIEEHVVERIGKNQTWGMTVHKRRWQQYHSSEIIECLAASIDRKVNLSRPDWIVWVDVVGLRTAISLLRAEDIFSLGLPHP